MPAPLPIDRVYREESSRILATLIRLVGDFDLAEEVMHDAFAAALEQWPGHGLPENPRAWLVSTARHKAIDRLRRDIRFRAKQEELARWAAEPAWQDAPEDVGHSDSVAVADDRLRLIFTCCHPALALEAQLALTLRTLGGLTTEEIARAFLVPVATMAQRLVRAKQKIRTAGIPYRVPPADQLEERVEAVLSALYLVFNEGYAATSGPELLRPDLCAEAIRLARIVVSLMPGRPEASGLLALMLLHDARRAARVSTNGELVRLELQDRRLWNRDQMGEGIALTESALKKGGPGSYALQAAIAALHAEAADAAATDWRQIVELYGELCARYPSPVAELNRAAAVGEAYGAAEGLRLLDDLDRRGELARYHLLFAARARFLARLGRKSEAAAEWERARDLATNAAERRFIEREIASAGPPHEAPNSYTAK